MFARERKEAVLIYLKQHKKANIQELVDEFQVTGATIRTDLRELGKSRDGYPDTWWSGSESG